MEIQNNNTGTNKGQEFPIINLNLQTEAAQHIGQQGQAKEGGVGGGGNKTR